MAALSAATACDLLSQALRADSPDPQVTSLAEATVTAIQHWLIGAQDVAKEKQARDNAAAMVSAVHEIDHEVEKLMAQVRSGALSENSAGRKLLREVPMELLTRVDGEGNRKGLYADFRISTSPGWCAARRFIWGGLRLLGAPESHWAKRDCRYVDFATGTTKQLAAAPLAPAGTFRLVCISDTHLRHRDLLVPAGDVLVHCGDVLLQGGDVQPPGDDAWRRHVVDFQEWLSDQRRAGGFSDVLC